MSQPRIRVLDSNFWSRTPSSSETYSDQWHFTVTCSALREGEPTFLRLGNIWLTINVGGGPTDDKPEVLASPLRDQNILSIFLNLRVTDIRRCYDLWSSLGARFITEPKVHATELRCYMRDPDGYLIEVGQTTMTAAPLDLYV